MRPRSTSTNSPMDPNSDIARDSVFYLWRGRLLERLGQVMSKAHSKCGEPIQRQDAPVDPRFAPAPVSAGPADPGLAVAHSRWDHKDMRAAILMLFALLFVTALLAQDNVF